ncbi:hypothetical protein [Pantoea sp. KPR_PJ]|uniref:hypothetical protein n=1 Tax=Pantoea sp. KPR_PJ TaxID=2738375 RepID=UPI0035280C8F
MKASLFTLGLLSCCMATAWGDTQFQITCPGRPTMTLSRAQYGLSTLAWPQHHFQIASGEQHTRLDGGDKVAITRFRNGDQLIVNKASRDVFFVYHDSARLIPCSRSETRNVDQLSLEPYDDRNHPHS